MVRQTRANLDKLNLDKEKWLDIFRTRIRSMTVYYTKRKYAIENSIRDRVKKDLLKLEAIPVERITPPLRLHQYNTPMDFPRMSNEKRSSQRTVIGELHHKNGVVYSDNENLMNKITDFYTDLYTPSLVDESVCLSVGLYRRKVWAMLTTHELISKKIC